MLRLYCVRVHFSSHDVLKNSLSDVVEDPALSFSKLSDDLNSIKEWALKWLVTSYPSKAKCMTFSVKRSKPSHRVPLFDGTPIEEVCQRKHLGVTLINNLSWKPHVLQIYDKFCVFMFNLFSTIS